MEKIENIRNVASSLNLKILTLGLIWALFVQKQKMDLDYPKKIIQVNFKTLYYCNFMKKIRKNSTSRFFIKLEKPYSAPILCLFWHKNLERKINKKLLK